MSFIVVIPARYASTRLPAKPLAQIAGKPMIQWVYERSQSSNADRVIVATDDERIVEATEAFGGEAIMTLQTHNSGTDRLQEVADKLSLDPSAIVVNVQGDEPLIDPRLINQVAGNLSNHSVASMATLCESFEDIESLLNPNNVKVIYNQLGMAQYFSRSVIPWNREGFSSEIDNDKLVLKLSDSVDLNEYHRHIGIYAYRVSFLFDFIQWPQSFLEKTESLEQLRALENGKSIHVEKAVVKSGMGIDTQEDLEMVQKLIKTMEA